MARTFVILVAEDEDNDFFLLERAFSKHEQKIKLVRARDGVEAVQYLEAARHGGPPDREVPDLLILDLKMPRKDGFEVLEWVRKDPALNALIVIILSSSREDRDVNRAYELRSNSFLMKPGGYLEFLELAQVLGNYWLRWSQRPVLGMLERRR